MDDQQQKPLTTQQPGQVFSSQPQPAQPTQTSASSDSQQEIPPAPIEPKPVSPDLQAVTQKPHDVPSKFKYFVTFAIVLIVVIYAVVAYLYFQNQTLKKKSEATTAEQNGTQSQTETPTFDPSQIKIQNGNIVKDTGVGDATILVDKANFPSTGITGFFKVIVSPDETKLCFESWSPAPKPALYVSTVEGQEVVEASLNRQNCVWLPDSKGVIYTNTSTLTSASDIFLYDLTTQQEKNLTAASVPSGVVRRYEIVGLSADDSKIICEYEDVAEETSGECEIDYQTGEVTLL